MLTTFVCVCVCVRARMCVCVLSSEFHIVCAELVASGTDSTVTMLVVMFIKLCVGKKTRQPFP